MKVITIRFKEESADSPEFAQIIRDFRKMGIVGFKIPKIKGAGHVKMCKLELGKKPYFITVKGMTDTKFSLTTPGKEQYKHDKVIKATGNIKTFLKNFMKLPVSKPYRTKITEFLE
jgi:hypothetical protein